MNEKHDYRDALENFQDFTDTKISLAIIHALNTMIRIERENLVIVPRSDQLQEFHGIKIVTRPHIGKHCAEFWQGDRLVGMIKAAEKGE